MGLTESCAMTPAASVAGLYFAHPEARYFGVGRIDRDQVEDYARRKGMEPWPKPNAGWLPTSPMSRNAACQRGKFGRSGPVMLRQIVEDDRPGVSLYRLHLMFLDHQVQRLVPLLARQALLHDDPFRVAGRAGVEGLGRAGRPDHEAEFFRLRGPGNRRRRRADGQQQRGCKGAPHRCAVRRRAARPGAWCC